MILSGLGSDTGSNDAPLSLSGAQEGMIQNREFNRPVLIYNKRLYSNRMMGDVTLRISVLPDDLLKTHQASRWEGRGVEGKKGEGTGRLTD